MVKSLLQLKAHLKILGHLSDSDSVEPVGSSRNKLKRVSEILLVESSQTAECEGYRLIDLKNLSFSVSSAHVYKGGENLSICFIIHNSLWFSLGTLSTGDRTNFFSLKSIFETCSQTVFVFLFFFFYVRVYIKINVVTISKYSVLT